MKLVMSVLRLEEGLWWERFVKKTGFKARVKSEGIMDSESAESTQQDDVAEAGKGKSEIERLG